LKVAAMHQRDAPNVLLALRLHELRTSTWPGVVLTQAQVARALGVSPPSVSSWESRQAPVTPPARRLRG
jgi:DNA-binding transcriptional regulator YiaG